MIWLTAAARAAEPAEDDWLTAARPEEEPAEPSEDDTFGNQLDVFGLEVTWSGYGDLVAEWVPSERYFTFRASHFNPILGATLSDTLYAEVELEFENSGTGVKTEYGLLDFTPVDAFGLRIGQFLVPIGDFNEALHPSFRWVQVGRPLMFDEVIPAVWSETGLQARGTVGGTAARLAYAAYLVNGLGSTYDPAAPTPLRDLRGNAIDQNHDLAFGGELGLDLLPGRFGASGLSASAYRGAIDPDGRLALTLADVAWSSELGPVVLRGELAHSFLNDEADPLEPMGRGLYGQLATTVGRVTPSVRYDVAQTGLQADPVTTQAVVGTVLVRLATFWTVRAEGGATIGADGGATPELSAMSAFFF